MIVRLAGLLLAAFVLFAMLVLGALSSVAGNRLLANYLEELLAPALTIEGVNGSILGELCVGAAGYETETLTVSVTDACAEPRLWRSFDFFELNFEWVRAAEVVVQTRDGGAAESEPDGELSLPIRIVADALEVGRLAVNALSVADLRAELDLTDSDLATRASLRLEGHDVAMTTTGSWTALDLQLQALNAEAQVRLNLVGDDLPWQASVSSPLLELDQFLDRPVAVAELQLTADGTLAEYRFAASAAVQDPLAEGAVSVEGAGDLSGLVFSAIDLAYVELSDYPVALDLLSGRGALRWADSLTVTFEGLSGRGEGAGQSLTLSAEEVALGATGVRVRGGRLALIEGGVLELDGTLTAEEVLQAKARTRAAPLALFEPRLAGLLDLEAELSGTLEAPTGRISYAAEGVSWDDTQVGSVRGDYLGTTEAGDLVLEVASEDASLDTAFSFTRGADGFALQIASAAASYEPFEAELKLDAPANLFLADDEVQLDDVCLTLSSTRLDAAPGRLCGSISYPDGGLTLELAPWAMPVLPVPNSGVSISGSLALSVVMPRFEPRTLEASLRFRDLLAHHPDLDALELGALDADLSIVADAFSATLVTPQSGQELLLDGTLEGTLLEEPGDSPLTGALSLELDGIWVAQSLLPMDVAYELDQVRGLMRVAGSLEGTLANPQLDGTFTLSDAGWRVLAVDAAFSEVGMSASVVDSRFLRFTSSATVGEGGLSLTGSIDDLNSPDRQLQATVTFDGAELIRLPDYRAAVDGELTLTMGAESLSIDGNVHLPRASVTIADLPETVVTASADEVLVDEVAGSGAQQIRTTDISMTLGDEVYLDAFGLTGRLTGNLRLTEAPGRLRSVNGIISLREAQFEAYGQKLRVERGQLTFAGPVDDPNVDVVASREIDYEDQTYKISLLITGTANDLRTEVRSQPTLPEDDALALLITGRTFSQMNSSEQSNVYGAALSMGLLSATGINQNLASTLNLEEIIVDQDREGNMEVGAAVRLNRDLYLRYTYGVFSRLGGVLLRYRFSKRFSVQAITGDAHSIEIRYGVDD